MNDELRIGDHEREAAVAALGEHFAAGRIDKTEYDERAAVAWEARTSGALAPLFADLPDPDPTRSPVRDPDQHATRPYPARGPWTRSYPFIGVLVVAIAVALAVATRMPWFVVFIAAWVVWMKAGRFGWHGHRSRHWHGHPGWGRPARW